MHMYFFAALACLVAYCDYRPILAGTVAVALHHLVLNFLLPAAIYPGGADLGRVVLHAVILLIEAGVLSWLALTLSQSVRDHRAEDRRSRSGKCRRSPRQYRPHRSRTAGQAGPRRGAARTRRRLRAQDRQHRRGGRGSRQRDAGPVLVDEQEQCGNHAADRRGGGRLDPGLRRTWKRWRRRPRN